MPNRNAMVFLAVLAALILEAPRAQAQVFSNSELGNTAAMDSLARAHWPYIFPIWGQKATAKGFRLPYPAGVSFQYFGQRSDILIDNLQVGFNNGPLHDVDHIIRFDKAKSSSDGLSLRPDVWLFPFLNVYGILGRSKASTEVGYGLWLPDSSGGEQEAFHSETKVDFDANTFGFGITPTVGVRGAWLALDMNFTWSDIPQLDQPAAAFVFDPRIGKSFTLGANPDRNLNLWAGGFRLKINTGTSGSIPLADALPIDQWQAGVDQGQAAVAQRAAEIEAWWNGLSPEQKQNPVNIAKYEAAKDALARASGVLDAAEQAVSNAGSSSLQYSLDKRPADLWDFLLGGQYQVNKSWMFRGEVGFLSSRTRILAGAQYRFGL